MLGWYILETLSFVAGCIFFSNYLYHSIQYIYSIQYNISCIIIGLSHIFSIFFLFILHVATIIEDVELFP